MGWLLLMLDAMKWPRIGAGRCWRCAQGIAIGFRQLIEEHRGATAAQDYAKRCKRAADAANRLALEMDAVGFRPTGLLADQDLLRGEFKDCLDQHLATLKDICKEPEAVMAKMFWQHFRRAFLAIVPGNSDSGEVSLLGDEPLAKGAVRVREITVVLRQTAELGL